MKTMVLPVHSVSRAVETKAAGRASASRSASSSRLCGSWKKSTSASATTGPTPSTADSSASAPSPVAAACKRLDRPERLHQILGGDHADVADAEPEQEARRIEADARLDRGEQVVDRLLLPALAPDQLVAMRLQPEDVGRAAAASRARRIRRCSFRPARRCPSPRATTKCCSRSIRCAGQISPPVQRTSTSPSSATASRLAFRAMVGKDVGRALLVAGQILDHLRDDVAGALDAHPVADAQARAGRSRRGCGA